MLCLPELRSSSFCSRRRAHFSHQFIFTSVAATMMIVVGVRGFNVDTGQPIVRHGPPGSDFGFALALHFRADDEPTLLVGAPRAESGQPGTQRAGAVFSCPLRFDDASGGANSCAPLPRVEYPTEAELQRAPDRLAGKPLPFHHEGKNHQLLGFVVESTGARHGTNASSLAIVCAPLLRWGPSATTDGGCYMLNGSDLTQSWALASCNTLPKNDRHNDYGACEQGFSAFVDDNVLLTGLPGARKWTGGVYVRNQFTDSAGFPDVVDRWTMTVGKDQNGVINSLTSHDYLGYSVRYGRFGFWYETPLASSSGGQNQNFTVVSGATRFQQTGAVIFLPFDGHTSPDPALGLTDDHFVLSGFQLGSGFGYSLAVLDLDANGFDDLVVGAPFEYHFEEDLEFGGSVYVFYSSGRKQKRGEPSELVFRQKPVILRGNSPRAQFGLSLTRLGNLDNDPYGFQDFAVGAPQEDDGHGAVYIYHGDSAERFSTEPAQVISARRDLGKTAFNGVGGAGKEQRRQKHQERKKSAFSLRGFGSALASNAVDLDGNRYPEVFFNFCQVQRKNVVLLRSRPVIDVQLDHSFNGQKFVPIDSNGLRCPQNSHTCFTLTTLLAADPRNGTGSLFDWDSPGDAQSFVCHLEVSSAGRGMASPSRAVFTSTGQPRRSWPCGRRAVRETQKQEHALHIPRLNQDWTTPLKFNFTVAMKPPAQSQQASSNRQRGAGPPLQPIVNRRLSTHQFGIQFDKQCGDDNDCHTNLAIDAVLVNITRQQKEEGGAYVAKVTERDTIVVRFRVRNLGERAFLAKLFVYYNHAELDEPQLVRTNNKIANGGGRSVQTTKSANADVTGNGVAAVDIERRLPEEGLTVVALGNPLDEGRQVQFSLRFKLVRGSADRVSAALRFWAFANSSSIEDDPTDNEWNAELRLIKEADVQLNGASRPVIVRFSSRGRRLVEDEMDIGPQVIHTYTLHNAGPFYATNLTLTINWPLRANTGRLGDWALYTLEEPLLRHGDEVRRCQLPASIASAAVGGPTLSPINPLGIYNDETQKLDYHLKSPWVSTRHRAGGGGEGSGGGGRVPQAAPRPKRENKARALPETPTSSPSPSLFSASGFSSALASSSATGPSLFDGGRIRPRLIEEASGARVRVAELNCRDGSALCVPLRCHLPYLGQNDSAQIEVRARLWNQTFSADYRLVDYITLVSDGLVEVDPAQGIQEPTENNVARVTTHAYPDRPQQEDRLDLWMLVAAVCIGLSLLLCVVLVCWRCGFFRRRKPGDPTLHKAHYQFQLEQFSET